MKIQCGCGTKYAFDVTPEMAANPIEFICRDCGADQSAIVNQLIRRELGVAETAPPPPVPPSARPALSISRGAPAPAPAPEPEPVQPPPAASTSSLPISGPKRVEVRVTSGANPPSEEATPAASPFCKKHAMQRIVRKCLVCQGPICPKCMEYFGYVCSGLCKEKADLTGIELPVYAGQKYNVEGNFWKQTGLMSFGIAAGVAAIIGLWVWYEWFGSHPGTSYKVRYEDRRVYSGSSAVLPDKQLVFLFGGTLARHDMKAKKEVWAIELVDVKKIHELAEARHKQMNIEKEKAEREAAEIIHIQVPSVEELAKGMERAAAASLTLFVRGHNVWVAKNGSLKRYDWETGKEVEKKRFNVGYGAERTQGDEITARGYDDSGRQVIAHFNLLSGQSHEELLPDVRVPEVSAATMKGGKQFATDIGLKGLQSSKPFDPAAVEEQVSHLSLPAKIALPATLSINRNQAQALNELGEVDFENLPGGGDFRQLADLVGGAQIIPTKTGYVSFNARLVEERKVSRVAMKAPPKESTLNGNLRVTQTLGVANEILNDMQRDRGGGTVEEDVSLYRVTLRRPGANDAPEWQGDVVGPPELYPCDSVVVLAAGKTIKVFDNQNKVIWESTLNHKMPMLRSAFDDAATSEGRGPCVERGDTLYVFDEGVLAAFDIKTGVARWRVPSVGVASIFFDDKGMIYANSSSASPESIKYSRQIDVTQKTGAVILKIEPRTGKILWTSDEGIIHYLSGKFIYTLSSYMAPEQEDGTYDNSSGFETPPYLRIKRISPKTGKLMWEHFQQRAPLDVKFDKNTIQCVFKKEVQVLRYLSF